MVFHIYIFTKNTQKVYHPTKNLRKQNDYCVPTSYHVETLSCKITSKEYINLTLLSHFSQLFWFPPLFCLSKIVVTVRGQSA